MCRQSEKPVEQQYLLHMSSQYRELRPTNGWDRLASLGHPSKFQRVSGLGFVNYCTDVAQRRSTKFCTMFGRLLGWYTVCAFSGARAPNGIPPGAKFNLRLSLAFSYILAFGSVTARHSSSGRQPNFAAYYLHTTGRPYRSTLGGRTV